MQTIFPGPGLVILVSADVHVWGIHDIGNILIQPCMSPLTTVFLELLSGDNYKFHRFICTIFIRFTLLDL